ncbi:unnamed protein product [Vitrella brassicaformis CCMP3155]|uniref:Uncharacterized protein n=1 Tax=Vitrella brassicaformis (strain CCMP3155) TaxID=1169540 RepID=A0A0G4EDA9_VITBC|nr:unnamed protein product [Vitrella brassicaformis CCMP3155]|eukprot:CEL93978.1 unnamed protein product [Vitrella brassicaformis CCMP3155]
MLRLIQVEHPLIAHRAAAVLDSSDSYPSPRESHSLRWSGNSSGVDAASCCLARITVLALPSGVRRSALSAARTDWQFARLRP